MPSHPADEMLLRLVDEDLARAESAELQTHLDQCLDCRERLDLMREASGQYLRFHETIVKRGLPAPPKPWAELDFRTRAVDFPAPMVHRKPWFPARRWLALAAAIGVVFLLVRRFEHTPGVKAAELLRKAVTAAREQPQPHRRIRIQTRNRRWDRAAQLTAPEPPVSTPESLDLVKTRRMFEAAGYSWEDPLSAQSFDQWRRGLPEHRDEVTSLPVNGVPQAFLVRTSTDSGPLSSAALTLRTNDLHAVACTLRFRADEIVDITELPDENPPPQRVEPSGATTATSTSPRVPETATPSAGPAEELHVIAALHSIGADLGEPIGVKLDGSRVLVSMGDLDARRREQVRTTIARVRGAQVKVEDLSSRDARAELPARHSVPQQGSANPLIAELEAAIGGDITASSLSDQFTDTTEITIERVYALRLLARRFQPETVAQLSPPDRDILNRIVQDHIAALAHSTGTIRHLLSPILKEAEPVPQRPIAVGTTWQDSAMAMLARAREIDQAMNGASDGPGDTTNRKAVLRQSLYELDALISALRGAFRP